jgi:glycosyltransferase involved in cell wall biosynthesis
MSGREKIVLSFNWALTIGGVAQYNVLLKDVRKYHPVRMSYVCILSDKWHTDESALRQLDATIIRIRSRWDFSWLSRSAAAIRELSPDLIITHGYNAHSIIWLMRRVFSINIPAVMSYHGLYHPPSRLRYLVAPVFNGFAEFYARRFVKMIVSVSEYSKRYLITRHVPAAKISVIHNGIPDLEIPSEKGTTLRRELGLTEQDVALGITSRIDHVKGLGYLIEAMKPLASEYPNLRLILVGTGHLEETLKQRVVDLGVEDHVIWAGFRTDIPACLAAFDIFVLPSLAEYHSIALLEAMRASKAIIATDVGGNTESVRHNKEALIIPPANVDAIVDAVRQMMNSPELQTRLAGAARDRFAQYFLQSQMIQRTSDWLMSGVTEQAPAISDDHRA